MKKFRYALVVGALVGILASLIIFFKGLAIYEVLAYFCFWTGLSLLVSYTYFKAGWLKGLVLSEIFAVPVLLPTISRYQGETLQYIIINIVLINGFLGMVVGYFNGLAAEELGEDASYSGDTLKIIGKAVLSGFAIGLIGLIGISISSAHLPVKFASLFHWMALSVVISFLNVRLKYWLAGMLTVIVVMLPTVVLLMERNPASALSAFLSTAILGAALGAINGKIARAGAPAAAGEI